MPDRLLRTTILGRWWARLPLASDQPLYGYVAAIALSVIATFGRQMLEGTLPSGFPFLTYFPAVVVTAFLFGWRAGTLAAVLGLFLSWYLFIPPRYSFALDLGSGYALALYIFVVSVDLGLIWLAQTVSRALVAEREKSDALAQNRELLFRELQHRVGNNLQMVAAMLALQQQGLNAEAAAAIEQAARRVRAIGATQRDLYRHDGSAILLGQLVERVCRDAVQSMGRDDVVLSFAQDGESAIDPDEAIPAAVILSETIGNALEHGLPQRRGTITVLTRVADDQVTIAVGDDGNALPKQFAIEQASGLGLSLASALADQLRGSFAMRRDGGRTIAELSFPLAG